MPPDVKRCVEVAYTKVMIKSWTMSVSTGGVHWRTYELAWLVATQIGYANHLDIKDLVPYDMAQFLP